MTVIAAFCPLSLQSLLDQNGCPIRGGGVYIYDAETTNARTSYRDAALSSAYTFPVLTDGFGRIPPIFIGLGNYKIVLKDAKGGLLSTIDDLPGATQTVDPIVSQAAFNTGDVKPSHTNNIQDGWLFLNAKTIGNANSVATARANDDVQNLFVALWDNDPSLAVSNGRGATAAADWAAGKTIALPDYRGRYFCGNDTMGATSAAGRITAFTTATPDQIGTTFGAESEVTTVDQLPTFTPVVTISQAGAITPTATADSQGSHTHTGSTSSNGDHTHTIPYTSSGGGGGGNAVLFGASTTTTGNAGAHTHTFTTDPSGTHTHNITVSAIPNHTHTATANPIGSGNPHSKTAPTIMGYWLIKI